MMTLNGYLLRIGVRLPCANLPVTQPGEIHLAEDIKLIYETEIYSQLRDAFSDVVECVVDPMYEDFDISDDDIIVKDKSLFREFFEKAEQEFYLEFLASPQQRCLQYFEKRISNVVIQVQRFLVHYT